LLPSLQRGSAATGLVKDGAADQGIQAPQVGGEQIEKGSQVAGNGLLINK
jgi:hypothetical protein